MTVKELQENLKYLDESMEVRFKTTYNADKSKGVLKVEEITQTYPTKEIYSLITVNNNYD